MAEYRQVLNHIALNQLVPTAYIPDFRLGIGESEEKSSQPILIQKNARQPTQNATIPPVSSMAFELASTERGRKVSNKDFPSEFFLGNPIEEV